MYAINLEQYLETLESLPVEMRKKFLQMRDLDRKVVDNLRNIDELSDNYLMHMPVLSPHDKTEQLKLINKKFKRCKDISDSKIQLAIQTYEMVDKYIRRLDAELAKFEAKLQHKAAIIMASTNSSSFNKPNSTGSANSQYNISSSSMNTNDKKSYKSSLQANSFKKEGNGIKRKLFETSLGRKGKPKYKSLALLGKKKKGGNYNDNKLSSKKLGQEISDDEEDDDDEIPRIIGKGNKTKKMAPDNKPSHYLAAAANASEDGARQSSALGSGSANQSSASDQGTHSNLNLSTNATIDGGAGVVFPFSHPAQILDMPVDPNEPTYCVCHQVSYGEMIGCDNPDCLVEWFHFGCVGLTHKPKGKWYCPSCSEEKGMSNTKNRKK